MTDLNLAIMDGVPFDEWIAIDGNAQRIYKAFRERFHSDVECMVAHDGSFFVRDNNDGLKSMAQVILMITRHGARGAASISQTRRTGATVTIHPVTTVFAPGVRAGTIRTYIAPRMRISRDCAMKSRPNTRTHTPMAEGLPSALKLK